MKYEEIILEAIRAVKAWERGRNISAPDWS